MRKVVLTLKEKEQYEAIKRLVETNGNKERTRIKLRLKSIRHVNRLVVGYKKYGKAFFVHGNRGRKPKHALTDEFKTEIELLYITKYFDCTYTQFTEYLADKRTVFEYNRKGTTLDEDNTFTQFAYACSQLGTNIETSSIPEFKPRIERLFGTLQTRLVSELRLAKITTIEEANDFLPAFLDKYNSQFALCINNTKSVFEKQPSDSKINLTLAILSRRSVLSGHVISFKNKYYRFLNSLGTPIYFGKGTKCMVIEAFDKSLYATVEDAIFSLEEVKEFQLQSENFDEILPTKPKKIFIPRMTHPFKRESFEKFIEKQYLRLQKELNMST